MTYYNYYYRLSGHLSWWQLYYRLMLGLDDWRRDATMTATIVQEP